MLAMMSARGALFDVPLIWWAWFLLAKTGLLAKDAMQNLIY